MICEKCKEKMNWSIVGNTQGWKCCACGWNVITTYIDEIYTDETQYSIYIKKVTEMDVEKIRVVAKTANVNFLVAKEMLQKGEVCILRAKAPEIKTAIGELQKQEIEFFVTPFYKY